MNSFADNQNIQKLGYLGQFALILMLLGWASVAHSDQKYLKFVLSTDATTDDNFSLSTKTEELEVHTGRLDLAAEFGRAHELGSEKLETKISGRKYRGDSENLKSFPAFDARASSRRSLSEVFELDLEAAYSKTRTSADEFEQLGSLLVVEERSQDKDKATLGLRAGLDWAVTEYWVLGVNSTLEDVGFKDNETTQLLNYQYFTNAVTIRRYLESNLHMYLQLTYSDFDANPDASAIQRLSAVGSVTKSGVMGMTWNFDELSRLDASYGFRRSEFKPELAQESRERGRQGSLCYSFRSEHYALKLNANESLLPRSDGALVRNKAAELVATVSMSERATLSLKAKRENEESRGRANVTGDNYAEIGAVGSYLVSHGFRWSAGIRHRRSLGGQTKAGNSVNLNLTWSPEIYRF